MFNAEKLEGHSILYWLLETIMHLNICYHAWRHAYIVGTAQDSGLFPMKTYTVTFYGLTAVTLCGCIILINSLGQ